jgi:hypothetical protein
MAGPPGWPRDLPPPDTAEFHQRAPGWLFDLCPPRYRDHAALRRYPRVLAWLAVRHAEAQSRTVSEAVSAARAELTDGVGPRAVEETLAALEEESARLLADVRGAHLVAQALAGVRFVPHL